MKEVSLNHGWRYRHLDAGEESWRPVTIPHDAMLAEPRSPDAPSGANSGWFQGRDYEYIRDVCLDDVDARGSLILEFDGVYQHCEVWLNQERLAFHPYGYTGFLVDLTGKIRADQKNRLRVVAHNANQPNSRWYSGAGIYRPVTLWMGNQDHLDPDGIRVTTRSVDPCAVDINLKATAAGRAEVSIFPAEGEEDLVLASGRVLLDDQGRGRIRMDVPDAKPWSPDSPTLYRCVVDYCSLSDLKDRAMVEFGIRTISWGDDGFFINGHPWILRGACIHHDNGILGAAAWPEAEDRKIALLKQNGYNAIRSAHNPASKALLRSCDRRGILVLDEYIDHWYIHKTQYDYVRYFPEWWRRDLKDMVAKDYNHPSVIMYSIGNEVSETAQKKGIALTREMVDFLHGQDSSRPVTCGVNIFFNFLSSIGMGVYSDRKAQKEVEQSRRAQGEKNRTGSGSDGSRRPQKSKAVGSQFFNDMAGIMGADFMKTGATLHACDLKTKDAFAAMDIAGYNYGIKRYAKDLKHYPHRLILGTETFCSDADEFDRLAQDNPRLIGDFVWAGMDYMGETGVGAWEYKDYAPKFSGFGWLTAGSGRLDLTGRPLGEAFYTRVALGGQTGPYIAVRPVNHTGERHSPSAWKMTDALDSWSWEGCQGRKAHVEVYARAREVALILNGRTVGRVRARSGTRFRFTCTYQPGVLEAIAYDGDGEVVGRSQLKSAGSSTLLTLTPETERVKAGGLAFVRVRYTDEEGIDKPLVRGKLRAKVRGGDLLGFGCGAPFNPEGFLKEKTGTYYGQALAVLRAPLTEPEVDQLDEPLELEVSDGTRRSTVRIPVLPRTHSQAGYSKNMKRGNHDR